MKKFIIGFFLALVVLLAILIYIFWPEKYNLTTAQKEGALTKLLGRKVDLSGQKTKEDVSFSDDYLSFKYPGNAVIYKYRDPSFAASKGFLSLFSYDLYDPRVIFNYTATNKESIKNIDDDASVHLRRLPERSYYENPVVLDGAEGIQFSKDETPTSERSIFVFKNGTVFSFVFTGPDPASLDQAISRFIPSLVFKN